MAQIELVNRQEAADILGVSTRTVDRYIAKKKFSIERENGKVFLLRNELENFQSGKNPVVAQVVKESLAPAKKDDLLNDDFMKYKILYEETKSDLQKRDELLRNMHYRLGSLETQAKQSIPLLEAESKKKDLELGMHDLSQKNKDLEKELLSSNKKSILFSFLSLVFFFIATGVIVFQVMGV